MLSGALVEYGCCISGDFLTAELSAPSEDSGSSRPRRERTYRDMRITHANTPITITATTVPITPATIDGVDDFDFDCSETVSDDVLDADEVEIALVVVLEVSVEIPRMSEVVGNT